MSAIDDLPEQYRLSYFLGDIVRNDSYAEHEARVLWGRLRTAGLGEDPRERDLARLIKQLRRMLRDTRVPAEYAAICVDALNELSTAHGLRAALVHDLLMHAPWTDGMVVSAIRLGPPRKIEELAKCADGLRRSIFRLRGLWIIAPQWLEGEIELPLDVPDLISWTRVSMGHIADTPGTIQGTPGDAPVPAGGWRGTPGPGG